MISEKYLAGFLDADGSIQVYWRHLDRDKKTPEIQKPYLCLEFSQEIKQDEVLYLIQRDYGGAISYRERASGSHLGTLKIFGKPAELILNRIRKFLVIKAAYADTVLSILREALNRKETSKWLKEERKKDRTVIQQFPSRKWLAGYIDGDGCLQARVGKGRTSAQPVIEICTIDYDRVGIDLIQKNFGGSINIKNGIVKWTMTMPPSKAIQLYDYCGQYMINKKEQLAFICGCAKMGHFRDGIRINSFLKQLKTHQHRLNEPKVDADYYVQQVVNLSK